MISKVSHPHLPASNPWSTSHLTPFPPWSPPTPQSAPVDPSKAVSPKKKGWKTNQSSRLTKGVPKKKTEQISATPGHSSAGGFGLHLLGLELGLLLLLLAMEDWNHWKTAGKPLEITGVAWTEHLLGCPKLKLGYPSFRDSSLECICCKLFGSVHHFLARKSHASPSSEDLWEKLTGKKQSCRDMEKLTDQWGYSNQLLFSCVSSKFFEETETWKKEHLLPQAMTNRETRPTQLGNPPVFFKAQSDRSCVGLILILQRHTLPHIFIH